MLLHGIRSKLFNTGIIERVRAMAAAAAKAVRETAKVVGNTIQLSY